VSKKNKNFKIKKTSDEEQDIMIKGYQEMAEINLDLSKLCFEAEREVEKIIEQVVECERCGG